MMVEAFKAKISMRSELVPGGVDLTDHEDNGVQPDVFTCSVGELRIGLHARIDAVCVPTAPKSRDSSGRGVGHRGWTTRFVPSHPLQ